MLVDIEIYCYGQHVQTISAELLADQDTGYQSKIDITEITNIYIRLLRQRLLPPEGHREDLDTELKLP